MSIIEPVVKSIVIGSSNVYRFVDHIDEQLKEIVSMRKCTKIEVFKALMASLKDTEKRVIITVIENFLADAVRGLASPEEIKQKISEVMREFIDVVETTSKRLPATRFAII